MGVQNLLVEGKKGENIFQIGKEVQCCWGLVIFKQEQGSSRRRDASD